MAQKIDTADKLQLQCILDNLVNGIDISESTEWEKETSTVSVNIRKSLMDQMKILKSSCDDKFLDYCNCVKSLLAVYNYGNLGLDDEKQKCKDLIRDGISKIINHVETIGYDITPYLTKEDSEQIFGPDQDEGQGKEDEGYIPITFSATTVFTTLVYFRRACKRKGLYSDEELGSLTDKVAETMVQILHLFAKYVLKNDYKGWGFTLDSEQSYAITLNDTYAVVDAISRFDDAFNSDDKTKRDQEFLDKITLLSSKEIDAELQQYNFKGTLIDCCVNATSRVACSLYIEDKKNDKMYGRNIFFVEATEQGDDIDYTYYPISIEQIASSNRASALFNPLYFAMITMYGYNDKELVIRRFMDDNKLAQKYYNEYEKNFAGSASEDTDDAEKTDKQKSISQYAETELKWYNYSAEKFNQDIAWIISDHSKASTDYSDYDQWKCHYDIARVFQKYVETQVSDDLMKIDEYRDYLNATKDAIDQVQVAYRKLDDSQRLGIVDTDYLMFSTLDIDADSVTISKLNKANISVNYLRPMLLSSKIMIVNALIKYPQSDMASLYNAIKESKHRKTAKKKQKGGEQYEWLWNEDAVDMNATARHCEAIMYDYFDYYEKYELGYKALTNLKKYYAGSKDSIIKDEFIKEDGTLDVEKLLKSDGMNDFRRVVLNLTRRNVDEVSTIYTKSIQEKDDKIEELNAQIEDNAKVYAEKIEELKKQHTQALADERAKYQAELDEMQVSYNIGDTVRGWIREEADRHLQEMMAYMILNNINGKRKKDVRISELTRGEKREIADGKFEGADTLAEKIMQVYHNDQDEAERRFGDKLREARRMQIIFEGALDDILRSHSVRQVAKNDLLPLETKNQGIFNAYDSFKTNRANGIAVQSAQERNVDDDTDEGNNEE